MINTSTSRASRAASRFGLALVVAVVPGLVGAMATAQDGQRLDLYLNSGGLHDDLSFAYTRDGCEATVTLEQTTAAGDRRTTLTRFRFDTLDLDDYRIGTTDDDALAQLILGSTDGSAAFYFEGALFSEDSAAQDAWTAQGALCIQGRCDLIDRVEEVALVIEGPLAGARAEFVLADLRDLADTCRTAAEEEG